MNVKKLMTTPVFLHLSEEKLQAFVEYMPNQLRTYPVKDFIALQDSPCQSLYLLYDGKVRASMSGPDGKQITMEDLEGPVLLAPAFLFATNNRFPVNIYTLTPCEVLVINKEGFVDLMCREPIIMQNFLRIISDRSQILTQKIGTFALQSLKSRLASYLYEHGTIANQREVAERLGVARPSLSRVLAEFAAEGCIAFEKRKMIIIDKELLKTFF